MFKDEMMAGTEETGGLAEEQELPKTRSNDWLFDWRGKKSVTKGQVRPHFFHLTVQKQKLPGEMETDVKCDSKASIFPSSLYLEESGQGRQAQDGNRKERRSATSQLNANSSCG